MFRRVLAAAVLSAVVMSAASAATVSYTAKLSGRAEVPKTDSKGKGKLEATLDTQTKAFNYTLTFDDLSGPATAAHVHGPANRTHTAGVVAPLGDKSPTSPITGSITMTDDQIKLLKSAKLYVNVHTAASPAGEIRGQITGLHTQKHPAKTSSTPAMAK